MNADAIKQVLDQRDALNSVAHLLLNELEATLGKLIECAAHECYKEDIEDAQSVITHARKVFLAIHAKA